MCHSITTGASAAIISCLTHCPSVARAHQQGLKAQPAEDGQGGPFVHACRLLWRLPPLRRLARQTPSGSFGKVQVVPVDAIACA